MVIEEVLIYLKAGAARCNRKFEGIHDWTCKRLGIHEIIVKEFLDDFLENFLASMSL